ncbi:MAG: hypothetical protein KBB54_00360 [Candidatus Pacebacteria bacterium]|nr:hypothetical protein [Candidatus Paceibacterota bacterium]MBP9818434.1 hypothetical protein [Candidatus Paceibacterota bacterium]
MSHRPNEEMGKLDHQGEGESGIEHVTAQTFDELYTTLRGQDSNIIKDLLDNVDVEEGGTKNVEDLIFIISEVRAGNQPVEVLTQKHDLRGLVEELISHDKEKSKELGISNFADLYKTLDGQSEAIIGDLVANIDDGVGVDSVKEAIEKVRLGALPLEAITSKHDLRDIVEELMKKESASFEFKHEDSFGELYATIKRQNVFLIDEILKNIDVEEGSLKNVNSVIDLIEGVKDGIYPIEAITDKYNLRSVVQNLIQKETVRKQLSVKTILIPRPQNIPEPSQPIVKTEVEVQKPKAQEIHKGWFSRIKNWFK